MSERGIQRYEPVLAGALGQLPKNHQVRAMMVANADGRFASFEEVERLRGLLLKVLDKLPDAETVEALKADAGLGYRYYPATFTDTEVEELRAELEGK